MNFLAPRVAFFPDSFLEVNGLAMTSRKLVAFARKKGYPLLCVHTGRQNGSERDGTVEYLSLRRSPAAIRLDEGLAYDPLFQRHALRVVRTLRRFRPDLLHVTGPNDVGIMGAFRAWHLGLPLVASWHTNIHEFAAWRLGRRLSFLPADKARRLAGFTERRVLCGAVRFYRKADIILAPNHGIARTLARRTGREVRLMTRGVDTSRFDPGKRSREDGPFRLGYVGRLRAEKNVRLLGGLERELIRKAGRSFEFWIVGEGSERRWLEAHLEHAVFTGFLHGEDLARTYADLDVFVFPSDTDASGNTVQEANASGVPCLVTGRGGPGYLVGEGQNGWVCRDLNDFVRRSLQLMEDGATLSRMRYASRAFALTRSWDEVFESVYRAYRDCAGRSRPAGSDSAPSRR